MHTTVSWLWITVQYAWKNYRISPGGSHVNHVTICITCNVLHCQPDTSSIRSKRKNLSYAINGCNSVERHRTRIGGGVVLFIKDDLNLSKRTDLAHFDEDMKFVYIEIGNDQLHSSRGIVIGVIYRPPNRDIAYFNEKLCIPLERIKKEKTLCYSLGDYNINLLNHKSHLDTGAFIDMPSSYLFVPLITRPTRVTATTATLIDNILTNSVENIKHSDQGILVTDVTVHSPVFHIHRIPKNKETEVYFIKRIYSMNNKQAFLESIAETDCSELYSVTSTETAFNAFHDKVMLPQNRGKKRNIIS